MLFFVGKCMLRCANIENMQTCKTSVQKKNHFIIGLWGKRDITQAAGGGGACMGAPWSALDKRAGLVCTPDGSSRFFAKQVTILLIFRRKMLLILSGIPQDHSKVTKTCCSRWIMWLWWDLFMLHVYIKSGPERHWGGRPSRERHKWAMKELLL